MAKWSFEPSPTALLLWNRLCFAPHIYAAPLLPIPSTLPPNAPRRSATLQLAAARRRSLGAPPRFLRRSPRFLGESVRIIPNPFPSLYCVVLRERRLADLLRPPPFAAQHRLGPILHLDYPERVTGT